jgi:hypothetical protein
MVSTSLVRELEGAPIDVVVMLKGNDADGVVKGLSCFSPGDAVVSVGRSVIFDPVGVTATL